MRFKTPLLAITMLILIVSANAQDLSNSSPKKLRLGLQAGINISYFKDRIGPYGDLLSHEYDNFFRISPVLGLHGVYKFSRVFSVRSELLINSRGGSYRGENPDVFYLDDGGSTYLMKNYRVNYLEIPIIGEFDFPIKDALNNLRIGIGGGFSYGLAVSSTLRYNDYTSSGSSSGFLVNMTEDYNVEDFSYARGSIVNYIVDLSFYFDHKNLVPAFVKLRYNSSLTNVYKMDSLHGANLKTKMDTWSICFGFYFTQAKSPQSPLGN